MAIGALFGILPGSLTRCNEIATRVEVRGDRRGFRDPAIAVL
jgi:hypothetical protein